MTLIFKHSPFRNDDDPLASLLDRFGIPDGQSTDASFENSPGSDPLTAQRDRRQNAFDDFYSNREDLFPNSATLARTERRQSVPANLAPAAASAAGAPVDVGAVVGGDEYLSRLAQVESGGNANARASTSSATGLFQFIDSTALQYKERLGYGHLSDAQFLALRTDPQVSARMASLFTDDNRRVLARNNLPTDSGALYLAHFAGAGTATRVLSASRDTPISAVLTPAAIRANAGITFRGRRFSEFTAGDLTDWARYKFRSRS